MFLVRRNNLGTSKISNSFRKLMTHWVPVAAAASTLLIAWYVARDTPSSAPIVPAPLAHTPPDAPAADTPAADAPAADRSAGSASPASRRATAVAVRPAAVSVLQAGVAVTIEVIVGRNDTLDAIFHRVALDKADLAAIRHLPGIRQSLDFLKPGDAIKLTRSDGALKELTRKVSETQTLKVVREDDGFAAKMIDNPVETRIRRASATIDSSLFQAAGAADISDTVALKLANIFAWDIDFVLDIREGDRFTAVYEQIYQDGKYLRDGEVLAAEFVNNGKVYRAVRFAADDSRSASYYTPAGQPMRKAFLRAPVEFTRVSSVFNPHRLHPILNLIRGHMGTDYAAPIGTPVHAAGDGRVSFAGQRGGYGNAIVLAHSSTVSTLYGHMSRFASHLRVGAHVLQGDVIGYVGMTGLATGPHLHYEYLVNGVHKNPQTVQLPGAEPLHAGALQKFLDSTAPLLAVLTPQQSVPNLGSSGPLAVEPAAAAPPFAAGHPLARAQPPAAEQGPIAVYKVSSILGDSLPRRQWIVDFDPLSL
jgi:murein DD-endopeptidase MepM/ murein hydrolase activator NlpD